ncbi:MAG: hypothetical protein ACTSQJ_18495 [Promethearchaeota archaeon]
MNKFIGTLTQKELLKLYTRHVNAPKVRIFKGFGFGLIPEDNLIENRSRKNNYNLIRSVSLPIHYRILKENI